MHALKYVCIYTQTFVHSQTDLCSLSIYPSKKARGQAGVTMKDQEKSL